VETNLASAPCLASYADDYPHGKYYIACMADVGDLLAEDRDVPLEAALGSQTSFANLDFPDNFFDVIVAGYLPYQVLSN
jgi:hypothetical protein